MLFGLKTDAHETNLWILGFFLNALTLGEIVIHHHMLKPLKITDPVSHDPEMKINRDGLPRKVSSLKNIAEDSLKIFFL